MKRPAFQFYPADWRKDMALQSCSVAARGLWVDILCIAHECEPYGHLTVNGKPMSAAQIGRHTGLTQREAEKLLQELADAGVSSTTEDGVIYSRRMVRDEDIRNRRAEGGKEGSKHGAKGAEHGSKGGRPANGRGVSEPPLDRPLKPPPSSSSSASASSLSGREPTQRENPPSCPEGVDAQTWSDWLKLRKAKKAPVTATVIAGAKDEAAKAGLSLQAFLRIWCTRGTQGLQADWLKPSERASASSTDEPQWRREQRERTAAFAGPAAAKRQAEIIDMEPTDATSRLVG